MRFQEFTNARFQDRDATGRSDAAAVHDADAAMLPAPAGLEDPPDLRAGGVRRQAVQIAVDSRRIVAALQVSNLAPVDSVDGEVYIRTASVIGAAARRRRCGNRRQRDGRIRRESIRRRAP